MDPYPTSYRYLAAAQRYQRAPLRRAVERYRDAGWPIAAGAWWDGTRFRCQTPSCGTAGLHAAGHGLTLPSTTSAEPRDRRRHPHTILLRTGLAIDAIELPARATAAIAAAERLPRPPAVARLPTGRWLLFAATHDDVIAGDTLPDTASTAGITYHGHNSTVPLPPSRLATGPVRWHRRPWAGDLPPAPALLDLVTSLLTSWTCRAPHPDPRPRRPAATDRTSR